jgi:hypothetical protein
MFVVGHAQVSFLQMSIALYPGASCTSWLGGVYQREGRLIPDHPAGRHGMEERQDPATSPGMALNADGNGKQHIINPRLVKH